MFHVKHAVRLLYFIRLTSFFHVLSVISLRFNYTYITPADIPHPASLTRQSNIRAGIFGVFLNELFPRFDFVTHQKGKGFVS